MKVKEMIKILQGQDPEAELILSSDEEGNTMHLIPEDCLSGPSIFKQDKTKQVETWDMEWSAEDACETPENWEKMKEEYPKCIILYP